MVQNERLVAKEFSPQDAGVPVVYANVNILQTEDEIKYGRLEVVASSVSPEGASLTFYRSDGGKRLYSFDSAIGFDGAHGVEVGFLGDEINDGRMKSRETPSELYYADPGWIVDATIRDKNYSEGGFWFAGKHETTKGLKEKIGSFGLAADKLYKTVYYNLAVASEGDPVVIDRDMENETDSQLVTLHKAKDALEESLEENRQLALLIANADRTELPQIAESEFAQSRRGAHQRERVFWRSSNDSAMGSGMRQFIPVGHGRAGRSWSYMDASVEDEAIAFGKEQQYLQRDQREEVHVAIDKESRELQGRIAHLDDVIVAINALRNREREK